MQDNRINHWRLFEIYLWCRVQYGFGVGGVTARALPPFESQLARACTKTVKPSLLAGLPCARLRVSVAPPR